MDKPFANIEIEKSFASSLGRKDQKPNIDLANKLAKTAGDKEIKSLLYYCSCGTKAQKSDAIKTIYELANLRPELFLPHIQTLVNMLENANNRMIWGLLQALNALSEAVTCPH